MGTKAYVMTLPLGISRAWKEKDIKGLHDVLGNFKFIDFNVSRTSAIAYSIQIKRSSKTRQNTIALDETVGGIFGDRLRLTYGEQIELLSTDGFSFVEVIFSCNE